MSNMEDPGRFAVDAHEHVGEVTSGRADNPVASAICAQAEALLAVAAAIERLTDRIGEISTFGV